MKARRPQRTVRTLEQKRKAAEHRQAHPELNYAWTDVNQSAAPRPVKGSKNAVAQTRPAVDSFGWFGYETSLLYRDILKTLLIAGVVMGLLAAIVVFT